MTDHSDQPPTTISGFLAASTVHDADAATPFLTGDAVVVDQGGAFRGREALHASVRGTNGTGRAVTDRLRGRPEPLRGLSTAWSPGQTSS